MIQKHFSIIIILLCLFGITHADEPIVLQNGTNAYEGCTDTYLATADQYKELLNENFNDSAILKMWS